MSAKKLRSRRSMGDEGFTLLEAAISIPLVGIMAALIIGFIGVSVVNNAENTARLAGIAEVSDIYEKVGEARSCYELGELLKSRQVEPERGSNFIVKGTIASTCKPDEILTVSIQARSATNADAAGTPRWSYTSSRNIVIYNGLGA